jgi:hypothetical protein
MIRMKNPIIAVAVIWMVSLCLTDLAPEPILKDAEGAVAKSWYSTYLERLEEERLAKKKGRLPTGWDIPGEPGNWVPRKSLVTSKIFTRNHAFLFKMRREEIEGGKQERIPELFKGYKFFSKSIFSSQRNFFLS